MTENNQTFLGGSLVVSETEYTPNPAAIIDLNSSNKGLLFPRMETTDRDLIPDAPDGLVIYNNTQDTLQLRRNGEWVNIAGTGDIDNPIANTIFVTSDGNDDNTGFSEDDPLATIEKALFKASNRNSLTLIKIGPGIYETEGHLDLPDNCIVQGVHRAVFIRPKPGFEERNVFRLGSGCFVEGLIIENSRVDSLTDPTEGFAFSFRPGAVITRVPYAHKCAIRSAQPQGFIGGSLDVLNANPQFPRGAGVALADGMVCSQYSIFPNIMTWGATPVSYNGIGYCAKRGGLINAVNAISMWAHKHFVALSGGQIILSSCATQFGDYSLVADGSREVIVPKEMTAALTSEVSAADLVAASRQTIVDDLWYALVSGGYTTTWDAADETFTRFDSDVWIRSIEAMLRGGSSDMIERFQTLLFTTMGDPVFSSDKTSAFVFSYEFMRDAIIDLGININAVSMVTNATETVISTIENPTKRLFPSRVEAIGHTWTANMIGVWAVKIPPAEARLPIRDSILELNGGSVIATGQDSAGNAIFAGDVTIDARFGMGGRGFIAPTKREAIKAAITFGGF